jgi:hypothetical protein
MADNNTPMYTNKLTDSTVCTLENPWSRALSEMTWEEIKQWAALHVHPTNRRDWLNHARRAALKGDAETLGAMIIGA